MSVPSKNIFEILLNLLKSWNLWRHSDAWTLQICLEKRKLGRKEKRGREGRREGEANEPQLCCEIQWTGAGRESRMCEELPLSGMTGKKASLRVTLSAGPKEATETSAGACGAAVSSQHHRRASSDL